MGTNIIFTDKLGQEKIGSLVYGAVITDAPSNPGCVYIKVDKRKLGQGLTIRFPEESSVLLNIKTGGLRQIPGNSMVTVLQADVRLTKLSGGGEFLKWRVLEMGER